MDFNPIFRGAETHKVQKNPLVMLHALGQSVWLDYIEKEMLTSGKFEHLVHDDGLLGVTSNPSIFEKVITGSHDYDSEIDAASLAHKTAQEIYEELTIHDIQKAADLLRKTYEDTKGADGFVSLEVSPHLAYNTAGTIAEARLLWQKVDRPNLLVKVPGTAPGLGAIKQLISEGINVNVTLLFGLDRYAEVAEAYLAGLEERARQGQSVKGIASVASFFVSRIDTAVDAILPKKSSIHGQTAISCAKLAYQKYNEILESDRFQKLRIQGAMPQRLLWASTSTKDRTESDIKYVEALIGPDTINTIPLETLEAYRDHGHPASRLGDNIFEAEKTLKSVAELNIDLSKVAQDLEDEGVGKFSTAYDKLITSLEAKRKNTLDSLSQSRQTEEIVSMANCGEKVENRISQLIADKAVQRLWANDPSLWKTDEINQKIIKNSLGWLHIAEKMKGSVSDIMSFVEEIKRAGFEHVVHMGMGGSSLAALVFSRTFSSVGGLPLTMLDTTDPETILKIENSIPLERTLFIVASKSGTTAEPLAFKDYFYECVKALKGEKAGENFVAITDPNTALVTQAKEQNFRRIFLGAPDIGGRYSALSYFGLLPAALLGVDIGEILNRALESASMTSARGPVYASPALRLGAVLGELGRQKINKVTFLIDKPIESLGLWLEQLLAESTGKEGTGLIPVANEPLGKISAYGNDRLFVYLTLKDYRDDILKKKVSALKKAGLPLVIIELNDKLDLGREFFQWEFATAIAGSILKINAFDQPNVQESKDNTDELLQTPPLQRIHFKANVKDGPLDFYSEMSSDSGSALLYKFLRKAKPGDYIDLMAFVAEVPMVEKKLQSIRKTLRDDLKLASTLGYGPRFLHSTGQLHKGGPNTGLFLQLTADDQMDVLIPRRSFSFSVFKKDQAQGDLAALHKHGRRAMRIHLGTNIEKGLDHLASLLNTALGAL